MEIVRFGFARLKGVECERSWHVCVVHDAWEGSALGTYISTTTGNETPATHNRQGTKQVSLDTKRWSNNRQQTRRFLFQPRTPFAFARFGLRSSTKRVLCSIRHQNVSTNFVDFPRVIWAKLRRNTKTAWKIKNFTRFQRVFWADWCRGNVTKHKNLRSSFHFSDSAYVCE